MKHTPLLHGALLVPAAILAISVPSQAQKGSFGLRLGAARLMDGDSRDAFGSTGKLGLSYQLPALSGGKITPRFDLDYARFSDSGNRLTNFGLAANALIPLTKSAGKGPYALAGLGIYRVSVKTGAAGGGIGGGNNGGGNNGGGSGGSDTLAIVAPNSNESKTKLGVNLGAGYKFSDRLSGEISYTILGKVQGAKADHLALTLGVSF
jgi:hypothetical protein